MTTREAVRRRMLRKVREPDRPGFPDQQPEDAAAVGQVADLAAQVVVDADGADLREPDVAAWIEPPEGGVPRIGELGGGLRDAVQDGGQVELRPDRDDRL